MLEVIDYSSRRGVIVPLLGQVYALLAENAEKDKLAGLTPPANIILWKQTMNRYLVDIRRRWLFVMDDTVVAGLMFFRFGEDPQSVYIDELQIAWLYRRNEAVLAMLLDKFQSDRSVKACTQVYAGERIKKEEAKEILASVGLSESRAGKPAPSDADDPLLGTPREAVNALKLRYHRP